MVSQFRFKKISPRNFFEVKLAYPKSDTIFVNILCTLGKSSLLMGQRSLRIIKKIDDRLLRVAQIRVLH
jgi:hypothetical protein